MSQNQKKSGKELCEIFEKYCQFYFNDYDISHALFSCSLDEELYQEETGRDWEDDDGKYTWYPSYPTYKQKIEKEELKVDSFLYRNVSRNEYLWWIVGADMFPCWVNRGTAYASFQTEDTKVSSWLPANIPHREKKFHNDGRHDGERYSLDGEQVSVGEAVAFFEEKYLGTLPFDIEDGYSVSVSDISVVKLKNGEDAYVLSYASTWNGIPYDTSGEYSSNEDNSTRFSFDGQAIMTKKNEVDMVVDFSFPKVTEKTGHKEMLSLNDSVRILNDKLTQEVKFEVQTIGLVYQGKYSEDYKKAMLSPAWKFMAYNSNDNLYYCFYVNADDGEFSSYSFAPLGG